MKKNFFLVLVLLFIVILDILLFKFFPFFIKPNLFLGYIIFLALFFSHTETVIWSFLIGTILDLIYLKVFGINSIVLLITGYLIGWLNKKVDERMKKVQIIILFLTSLLYSLLYIIFSVILSLPVKILPLFFSNIFSTVIFGYFQLQILIFLYRFSRLSD